MCDSGTTHDGKRLRIFGPAENPDEANCYMGDVDGDLSALIEQLREYLPQMQEHERFVIRVQAMTDADVDALPDISRRSRRGMRMTTDQLQGIADRVLEQIALRYGSTSGRDFFVITRVLEEVERIGRGNQPSKRQAAATGRSASQKTNDTSTI